MSGHLVDVLGKFRLIIKHTNSIPAVVDAHSKNVDGFQFQALNQGLEKQIRNSRKIPALGKLVDVAQADIQRTREAIDKAVHALLDKMVAKSGMVALVSRRIRSAEFISPS